MNLASPPWLELDPAQMAQRFGRRAFEVRHRLVGHRLFGLPRLVELAGRLPARQVEYNAGDVPITLDPRKTPQNGLSPDETIRRIEECNSWMVLKNVEVEPEYGALLDRCLAEVAAGGGPPVREMHEREAFVFVSSPGAMTPYHMDPEENFLLQVRGTKTLHVLPNDDPSVLSVEELEHFYGGAHRNLVFRERYRARAAAFVLSPGVGVHVPVTAPHWVQNGPAVSISFSITFRTRATARRAHAHRANGLLRRLGLEPSPVGTSVFGDELKHLLLRGVDRVQRTFTFF
ncbi:MAG TPA: hypothetical protein VHN19_01710 [Burkholderiales bacterium]|jgi:hypothetical protein|nr:hypothetical protein [Burkholderiales bacterium]